MLGSFIFIEYIYAENQISKREQSNSSSLTLRKWCKQNVQFWFM